MKIPPPHFPHLHEAAARPHPERGAHADSRLIALGDLGRPGTRERLVMVGGSLRIGNTPGKGTEIPARKSTQGIWHGGYAGNQPEKP
jgi:hypothetical protein